MISVFEFCLNRWPQNLVKPYEAQLNELSLLTLPHDISLLKKADKSKTIVVQNNTSVFTSIQILKMGYSHCLDASQPDFDREVLVSSLMLINPNILVDHKVPFFLRGLNPESAVAMHESHVISITKRSEIPSALNELTNYIKSSKTAHLLPDVANFTADELLSNALKAHKKKGLEHLPVHLFIGIDNKSFVIGCTDSAGAIDRDKMLDKLLSEFAGDQITPQESNEGAGIGLRLVLDGASSLYIHSVPDQKTVFCCGFKLKNIKSNISTSKHIHFSNQYTKV